MTITIGDPAPDVSINLGDGTTTRLANWRGQALILYFYPKDDTPGCTKEALEFSALAGDFEKAGAAIVGVSRDSGASHAKFSKKYDLTVALGADEAGQICEAFGVWVEKSMYGKKYMGIERATFLIDAEGFVRQIWRKVKVPGHAAEVLSAAKALK
jgi:thioredoxin-dependent peroxiredoxin